MITSQEINAMISMQQQQAASLGVPVTSPMAGISQYPPQFNYAPNRMGGQQLGQAFAGGMMNSAGMGAGGIAGTAFGITGAAGAAGFGAGVLGLSRAAGAFNAVSENAFLGAAARLNPMNSMMMGGGAAVSSAYAAGAAGGGGILGGLGGVFSGVGMRGIAQGVLGTAGLMNPISLAAMAASVPLQMMHHGAQQYSQTSAMLGSYNQFANPFASGGRGFSEGQMSSIVSGMRGIQEASPFISMKDMQQTMTRFNELGMNQGERDAEEFSRKFKAMAKTVTAMSKALGTTMDEASKVFGQMRGAGFYTGADVMGNTLLAGTMRGQGISGATMLGAQMAGGGMTRASGLGTTPGAKSVGGVMSMLTGARGAGALSNEEMMNMTGAATPDQAIAQLSTTMAGSLTNFYTQSGVGQAMLKALGSTDEKGSYTGRLDADAVEQLRSGKIDINNLVAKGRAKGSTRNGSLSFVTKGQDVAGALLSEGDPTLAIGAIMQSVAGDKFKDMDPENLITLLTERIQGLGRKEAEAMTKLYREGEKVRRESQRAIRSEAQAEIFNTDIRENHSISGQFRKVVGGFSDSVISPVANVGGRISAGSGIAFQQAEDYFFDVTRMGSSTGVVDQGMRDLLRANPDGGLVGGMGAMGFGTGMESLTSRALSGTATARDFTAPVAGDADYYRYVLFKKKLSNSALGGAIGEGQDIGDYIRSLPLSGGGGGGKVGDIMTAGGAEAERTRYLLSAAAAAEGSGAAIGVAAGLSGGNPTEQLAASRARQEALIGAGNHNVAAMTTAGVGIGAVLGFGVAGVGALASGGLGLPAVAPSTMGGMALGGAVLGGIGGALYGQGDRENLETLYSSGGMNVVRALASGNMTNREFISAADRARSSTTGGTIKGALGNVDTESLSEAQLSDYYRFIKEKGLEDLDVNALAKEAGEAQRMMDYSNLAGMAGAAAREGYGGSAHEELVGLANAAGGGDVNSVWLKEEELFRKLEAEGINAGGIDVSEFGALAPGLQAGLSHRNIAMKGSAEDIHGMLEKLGITDADLPGLAISDNMGTTAREDLAARLGRRDLAEVTSGSGGAFTSTTQQETAKYYAEVFSKVTTEIMKIQENNKVMQTRLEAVSDTVSR